MRNKAIFAPCDEDRVGIFNVDIAQMSWSDISNKLPSAPHDKFAGASMVEGKVVFAPSSADYVGIFDVATREFSTIGIADAVRGPLKFRGATATGGYVVFAPHNAAAVGLLNVVSSEFSITDISGQLSLPLGSGKFAGAASHGGRAIFAPFDADAVGVFEVASQSFHAHGLGSKVAAKEKKFSEAVEIDRQIVFAPFNAMVVGIFDTRKCSGSGASLECPGAFSTVDIAAQSTTPYAFNGAAVSNGRVIFAPFEARSAGVFSPADSKFFLIDLSSQLTGQVPPSVFSGAIAVDRDFVVFPPDGMGAAGRLQVPLAIAAVTGQSSPTSPTPTSSTTLSTTATATTSKMSLTTLSTPKMVATMTSLASWVLEASSTWSSEFSVDNVKDEDGQFRDGGEDLWRDAQGGVDQWIKMTAPSVVTVEGFWVKMPYAWQSSAFKDYEIQFSFDGSVWQVAKSGQGPYLMPGDSHEFRFVAETARHWKLHMRNSWGYGQLTIGCIKPITQQVVSAGSGSSAAVQGYEASDEGGAPAVLRAAASMPVVVAAAAATAAVISGAAVLAVAGQTLRRARRGGESRASGLMLMANEAEEADDEAELAAASRRSASHRGLPRQARWQSVPSEQFVPGSV